ncbi:GNAT family N-acetyltransferase [Virgibacillus doumboii]|uniref:GNAT family N-acetyltransferase n=1 Tax=Virgibacillus doumboii TaxID=2697503 RepID=UPI0013DFC24E|nr:GNAT family N-acetyltransferase [Virgibacillus doumboii]
MKIRKATKQDAPQIAKVHVDSWRTTYKGIVADSFLDRMSYDNRTKRWEHIASAQSVFVAENNDGRVVGFANGGKEREGNYPGYAGELYAIYIFKEYQGTGIGRKLVEAVVDDLLHDGFTSMLVWVLEDNDSKHFYEKMGGKKLGYQELEIDSEKHKEIAYGWEDIRSISR